MNERSSKEKQQRPEREPAPDVAEVEPRHHEQEDDDTFDRESRRRFDEEAQHPPGQPPA